jgi:hypothetical protein
MKDASQDNEKWRQCLRRARKLVSAVQRDQEEVLQRGAEWYLQSKAKVPNDMQNFVHSRNIPTLYPKNSAMKNIFTANIPNKLSWGEDDDLHAEMLYLSKPNSAGGAMMTMVKRFGSQGALKPQFQLLSVHNLIHFFTESCYP